MDINDATSGYSKSLFSHYTNSIDNHIEDFLKEIKKLKNPHTISEDVKYNFADSVAKDLVANMKEDIKKYNALVEQIGKDKALKHIDSIKRSDGTLPILQQHSTIWVKHGGQSLVLDDVGKVFSHAEKQGMTVSEISKELATRFADLEKPQNYWELVADTSLRKSEVLTEMRQYQHKPPKYFYYVVRMDNKTSQICRLINHKKVKAEPSKVFNQMDKYSQASHEGNVNGMKNAWKWHNLKEGSTQLPEGILVPPLHGFCRTILIPEY